MGVDLVCLITPSVYMYKFKRDETYGPPMTFRVHIFRLEGGIIATRVLNKRLDSGPWVISNLRK